MTCKESSEAKDYYSILESERTATFDELKRSFQRLALMFHPDKVSDQSDGCFQMLQQAWTVLRDPNLRKQYDAELACSEHSDCLLYETISLSDMEFSDGAYTYPCRCGGFYVLEDCESDSKDIIIPCEECSFSIQVKTDKISRNSSSSCS